jgi:aldose 1-epimerase
LSSFPSGEQLEITYRHLRATVVEVGGGLRTLAIGDVDILDGFEVDEMCHDGRGQQLLPWPNRLAGGRYSFAGLEEQLPLDDTPHGNAIHGLARWANWRVEAHSDESVTVGLRLHPRPGYPFVLDFTTRYALFDEGLQVTMRATNVGGKRCPLGAGHHPYFRAGTRVIDELLLRVPARTIHRYDDRLIPVERVAVEGTPLDFRALRRIGDTVLDRNYTDLERDADGRARIVLRHPGGHPSLEVWMDEAFGHVTVYSGETVQPPERRRMGVAIEPMTCAPNAFNSGDGLVVLEPGETWEGQWGVSIR